MANSGPDDNHTDTTQKPLGAIWCSLFWTCNWSWGLNLSNQSCPKGTYHTSVKVVLRICGSQASHYFLSFSFFFPIYSNILVSSLCHVFPLFPFPNYPVFLPSLCQSTLSALLSHLILQRNVKQ